MSQNPNKEIVLSKGDQEYLQIQADLNKPRNLGVDAGLSTRLHKGQIKALSKFYKEGKSLVVQPCGRKFGKSEQALYFLWRHALLNPRSACFYVTPTNSGGRKIVWDTWRLQRFLEGDSSKYVDPNKIKNNEMMVRFRNGSFIQVVGSENFGVANGLTPDCVVYDEFKLFHPRWHIDFAPNLVAKAAPLLIIGTLPTIGDKNYDQYFDVIESAKKDPNAAIIKSSTFDNPINHLSAQKSAIENEIQRLRDRGEEDVVQREYYSRIVAGGKRAVFPMLNKDNHIVEHKKLMEEISKDKRRMEWIWACDPGNTTVFGMLFACLNRYNGTLYILDEVYESDQYRTSIGEIVPRGQAKCQDLYPGSNLQDDWLKVADDAAAWFMTETMSRYDLYFSPAEKWKGTKEDGLSLIKDQLLHHTVKISSNCTNLVEEMQMYAKDSSGKLPKYKDHLIDTYRYINLFLNYDFHTIQDAVDTRNNRKKEGPDNWDKNLIDDFSTEDY